MSDATFGKGIGQGCGIGLGIIVALVTVSAALTIGGCLFSAGLLKIGADALQETEVTEPTGDRLLTPEPANPTPAPLP